MLQLELPAVAESDTAKEVNQLEVRLQGKLAGRVRDLRLLVKNRGLVLQGFAHTYHAKQLAQHAVMTESNFPIVANEIEVF
jgi:hypothetical protein